MSKTRKNWLLALSLMVLATLIFFTSIGIVRAGGVIKVICVVADLFWFYLTYEAIKFFTSIKSNKQ